MTNFNLVNGTALYTGNTIIPPSSPITPSTDTTLLLLATTSAGLLDDSSVTQTLMDNINGLTWSSDSPF
jgi:hypothetical protein